MAEETEKTANEMSLSVLNSNTESKDDQKNTLENDHKDTNDCELNPVVIQNSEENNTLKSQNLPNLPNLLDIEESSCPKVSDSQQEVESTAISKEQNKNGNDDVDNLSECTKSEQNHCSPPVIVETQKNDLKTIKDLSLKIIENTEDEHKKNLETEKNEASLNIQENMIKRNTDVVVSDYTEKVLSNCEEEKANENRVGMEITSFAESKPIESNDYKPASNQSLPDETKIGQDNSELEAEKVSTFVDGKLTEDDEHSLSEEEENVEIIEFEAHNFGDYTDNDDIEDEEEEEESILPDFDDLPMYKEKSTFYESSKVDLNEDSADNTSSTPEANDMNLVEKNADSSQDTRDDVEATAKITNTNLDSNIILQSNVEISAPETEKLTNSEGPVFSESNKGNMEELNQNKAVERNKNEEIPTKCDDKENLIGTGKDKADDGNKTLNQVDESINDKSSETKVPTASTVESPKEADLNEKGDTEIDSSEYSSILDQNINNKENDDISNDPLNEKLCDMETKTVSNDQENKNNTIKNDDNNDDDVQIIETCNSPILIESDDEISDGGIDHLANIPPNARTFARKSTARPQADSFKEIFNSNVQKNITNSPTIEVNRNRLRQKTSTINLIESSSDEERGKAQINEKQNKNVQIPNPQQNKTKYKYIICNTLPPKRRCLLPIRKETTNEGCNQNQSKTDFQNRFGTSLNAFRARMMAKANQSVMPLTIYNPTPQSEFLKFVDLMPRCKSSVGNPRAFAAKLNEKQVIIPNAFYTPKSFENENTKNITNNNLESEKAKQIEADREHCAWLHNFIACFSSKRNRVFNNCFTLLHNYVPETVMGFIRPERIKLNIAVNEAPKTSLDFSLFRILRKLFFHDYTAAKPCELTENGRRFCNGSCLVGNRLGLCTDVITKRISCYTRRIHENDSCGASAASAGGKQNRLKRFGDDEDYRPSNKKRATVTKRPYASKPIPRTRSNRNPNFNYNEDQQDDDFLDIVEESDLKAKIERERLQVQRKCEEKRLEAKRHSRQQAKSFENAFIEMFGVKSKVGVKGQFEPSALRNTKPLIQNTNEGTSILSTTSAASSAFASAFVSTESNGNSHSNSSTSTSAATTANNSHMDFESLLEANGNTEHRIYKVVPTQLIKVKDMQDESLSSEKIVNNRAVDSSPPVANQSHLTTILPTFFNYDGEEQISTLPTNAVTSIVSRRYATRSKSKYRKEEPVIVPEIIISDDDNIKDANNYDDENGNDNKSVSINSNPATSVVKEYLINNNKNIYYNGDDDFCLICTNSPPVANIVSHYVNTHQTTEVYVSRISPLRTRQLLQGIINRAEEIQNDGQRPGYSFLCIFCQIEACMTLETWREHLASHTGEFQYKCSKCGRLEATLTELLKHIKSNRGCRRKAQATQNYNYDTNKKAIDGFICSICNYIQLNQCNIQKHLEITHKSEIKANKRMYKNTKLLRSLSREAASQEILFFDGSESTDDADESLYVNPDVDVSASNENLNLLQGHNVISMPFQSGNSTVSLPIQQNTTYATFPSDWSYFNNSFSNTDDLSYTICGMLDVQNQQNIQETQQQLMVANPEIPDAHALGENDNDETVLVYDSEDEEEFQRI